MAETLEQKAVRILSEARLTVERVESSGLIVASCRSTMGEVYKLGYDPGRKEWRCGCDANRNFGRRCSHISALQRVVVAKPQEALGAVGSERSKVVG